MPASRFVRWLTLIALLLAPLAMIGGAPAMAHDRMAAAGHNEDIHHEDIHHEDMGSPAEAPPAAPVDCMLACAGLPAQGAAVALHREVPAIREPLALSAHLSGFQPEAATPPPRIS
jgi:hypothetical protein